MYFSNFSTLTIAGAFILGFPAMVASSPIETSDIGSNVGSGVNDITHTLSNTVIKIASGTSEHVDKTEYTTNTGGLEDGSQEASTSRGLIGKLVHGATGGGNGILDATGKVLSGTGKTSYVKKRTNASLVAVADLTGDKKLGDDLSVDTQKGLNVVSAKAAVH